MIKEEIKGFLANRRISQAVVAQVTGKSSWPPLFRSEERVVIVPLFFLMQMLGIWLDFLHCSADLSA